MFSFTPFRFVEAWNVTKYNVTPCLNYSLRDGETFFSHQAMSIEMSGKSSFPMFERTYCLSLSTIIRSSFNIFSEADRGESGRSCLSSSYVALPFLPSVWIRQSVSATHIRERILRIGHVGNNGSITISVLHSVSHHRQQVHHSQQSCLPYTEYRALTSRHYPCSSTHAYLLEQRE